MKSELCIIAGLSLLLCCFVISSNEESGGVNVGVGIADVTGPAAGVGLMGYANFNQYAEGIHTRLFSRAFIFQSRDNPDDIVTFVSVDVGMVDHGIKHSVIKQLQKIYSSDVINHKNVLLSGTHTHSGPGGFLQHLLYGLSTRGFLQTSFDPIVDGIVESISKAYENLQPGTISINKGSVLDASRNRSPSSYEANPEDEKKLYDHNVDTDMVQVRIDSAQGTPLGIINWFAVHPTSMNNTNRLISGDNKGYASMLFEYEMNPMARPGKGKFVAAFANSNSGDVSPNTKGAKCLETGESCELTGVCKGRSQKCVAFGPGINMEESTEIIGKKQFDEAFRLFQDEEKTLQQLSGFIKSSHMYINMSNYPVTLKDSSTNETKQKTTCPAALGFSFAAGTTDGPGAFDFTQGDTSGKNPVWRVFRNFIKAPSKEVVSCQNPKPILLPVGEMRLPYEWVPRIVETQILQVGSLFIIGFPGEITTMAGRRLRRAVKNKILETWNKLDDPHVVISALSNMYTHYVTTSEEYQKQRYEAASTLYGPYTLNAYLNQFEQLVDSLTLKVLLKNGPKPPIDFRKQWTTILPVVWDTAPFFGNFGDVLLQPPTFVSRGDTVVVIFAGGHPRNNPMRGSTFLLVERKLNESSWEEVATDADWSTKWYRPHKMSTESRIEITWKIPETQNPGIYRIRHFGHHKKLWSRRPGRYEGKTSEFKIS